MGRKKRPVATRTNPSSPLILTVSDDGDGVNGDVNGEDRDLSVSVMTVEQMNLENEVRLSIESEGYGAVKVECETALNAIRRGNHTKAIRLMKELCGKYENPGYLALVYRVQGTVCVKVATIIDDPNAKQRHLKNAIESAKKAVMLSPGSVEFAHFYANLIYETASDGKDYEDSVRECERALAIKNPIDPGKESLQDESQQKISAADARIVNVQNELRALLQKANLGTISRMRNLGHGEDKFRIIPIRRVPDDPMDARVVQGRRPNDIKKANKTDEERKKEIEVKVAAARLLQQKQELALTQPEADKAPEPSSGSGPRTGERRKSGKVKKNTSSDERKEAVLSFWKSMSSDLKKSLFEIKISDIKSHFKSLKDGLAYEAINEALSFGVDNNSWRFWMCCRCSEKFADPELHKHHVLHAHTESLSPELQAVLPPTVDSEWTEMLLTFPWKALDVHESVRMIELQSYSLLSNSENPEFANDRFGDSYCSDDAWESSFEEKNYDDGCNGTGVGRETHAKTIDCVPMECDQSEGCKIYSNPDSWPLSDDSDRMKLLEKIKGLFQLLIRHKCLAASHLTKVIQFAVEELHPQLLNSGVEQSPVCICFLGLTELKKVSMFLQELSHSCGVGRYTDKGMEELNAVTQVSEIAEKIVIDKDGSSLLLDELSLPCDLSWNTWEDNIGSEKRLAVDDDSLLSCIFSGPTSREQLTFWTRSREEKVHQGVELLDTLGKEFAHLQSLCERKMEHISYEEAVQVVEDLCLEEGKRTEFVRQSHEWLQRKRRHDISESDSEVIPVNKFEVEALTNVLKEADAFTASQFRYEDYGSVNSQMCDLESGEDDWRVNDYLHQLDTCIEVGIQKQKEHLSVELSKIDARIMRNVSGIKQLEAKIGPLCAHDFGLIVVPLVKSYLRAHIENLAEKDATEKELASDSKKGTGDVSKHSNDKLKDKRKNKEHRKSKDSMGSGTGDLHVSSQQEDEARCRKMENTEFGRVKFSGRLQGDSSASVNAERILDFIDLADPLYDIFTRLPVADLIRFGCVSRFLYQKVKEVLPNRLMKMLLIPSIPFHSVFLPHRSWICNNYIPIGRVSEDLRLCSKIPKNLIVGSVEGTVLIVELTSRPQNLLLVNPLTCFHKLIDPPRPNFLEDHEFDIERYAFGLGCTGSPLDLIVVVLSSVFGVVYHPLCEMYSYTRRSWKKLMAIDGHISVEQLGGTFHPETGSIYWIANNEISIVCPVILKFNIHTEEFTLDKFRGHPVDTLGTVKEKLCALTYVRKSHHYEIRYRFEDGWITLHRIEGDLLHKRDEFFFSSLLAFSDEGELFFLNKQYLVIYKMSDNSIESLKIPSTVNSISYVQGAIYSNIILWTLDYPEDAPCNAKDTGLSNEVILEDGAFSERRPGRRGEDLCVHLLNSTPTV